MAAELAKLIDKQVCVVTSDGRNVVGLLKGYDQQINIVLSGCLERHYSPDQGVVETPLGAQIIQGSNVAIIGEVNLELEAQRDLSTVRGHRIKPVRH